MQFITWLQFITLDIWWICVYTAPRQLHKTDVLKVTEDELRRSVHTSVWWSSVLLDVNKVQATSFLVRRSIGTYDQLRFTRTVASAPWCAWDSWSSCSWFMNWIALNGSLQISGLHWAEQYGNSTLTLVSTEQDTILLAWHTMERSENTCECCSSFFSPLSTVRIGKE